MDQRSPKKAANDLSVLLHQVLGEERFKRGLDEIILEYTKNQPDPIAKVVGGSLGNFEGMLRPGRKKPCWHIIYNNDTDYRGRERFTLAHELGHYLLHRLPLNSADFAREMADDDAERRTFSCNPLDRHLWQKSKEEIEGEADTFASYLLMPLDDYRQQVAGQDMSLDLLRHVARRYGVSLTAVVRKWIEFTDQRAAMVVARDGFALWGWSSDSAFKSGIFIRSGLEIPEFSIAALGPSAQNSETNLPIALPENIWAFSRGSEPVRELTIFASRLGQSLSILLFDDVAERHVLEEPREWDTYDQFRWRG